MYSCLKAQIISIPDNIRNNHSPPWLRFNESVSGRVLQANPMMGIFVKNLQVLNTWKHHVIISSDTNYAECTETGPLISGNDTSNESVINLSQTTGNIYIWRITREAFTHACLLPTMIHRGNFNLVWCEISCFRLIWYYV